MNKVYFKNVVEIGNLYLDYVFYEFESEPILFTCVDSNGEMYFCHCSDIRHEQIWFITKIDIDTLNALVNKYKDIASIFLDNKQVIKIIMNLQGKERSQIIYPNQIDSLDLPKPKTYLCCDKEKAEDYLYGKRCVQFKNKVDILATEYRQSLVSCSVVYEFLMNSYIQDKVYISCLSNKSDYSSILSKYAEHIFIQAKEENINKVSKIIQGNEEKPKSNLVINDDDLWAA